MPTTWAAYSEQNATLDSLVRRIHEISTLPHVALRVMEVAENPSAGAKDLKEVMEADPALSARVLRAVNSSAYALRQKVTSLQRAIAYLGIKQIRNMAMTAGVSGLFKKGAAVGRYDRTRLWKHLVGVGLCARLIAMRCRFEDFEDMFVAGLLHDVGIILEDQYIHNRFQQVVQSLEEGIALNEVERAQLGFDHNTLGESVARNWKFPEVLTVAIRHHHASSYAPAEMRRAVQCVEVANSICSLKGITSVGMNLVSFPKAAIEALGLSKNDFLVLAEDLDREIEKSGNLLTI